MILEANEQRKTLKKQNKKPLIKNAKLWMGVGIIFIFAGICTLFAAGNSATVTLSVRFDEVFEGKNPDGSPFEIREALSDEIIEKAIDKLGLEMSAAELKRHLTVSDLVDGKRAQKARENISESRDEYSDFPTTYLIKYATISEQVINEGVFAVIGEFFRHLTLPSKGDILAAVSESAAEVYKEKYVIDINTLNVNWEEADALDYYNRSLYAKKVAARLSRLMHYEYVKDVTFTSEQTKTGFGDLRDKFQDISEIDIENFKSYVVKNGVTKDREALLGQFNYMKNKNIETQERKTKEYEVNKKAVEMYDPNVTKVVFIPSLDSERNFYMNRTKVGVDYLVENANAAKKAADDAEHNVVNYDYLINTFSENNYADKAEFEKADALYATLKDSIEKVADEAKVVFTEHCLTRHEELIFQEPEHGFNLMSMVVFGGKLFVWLLLVCFVISSIFAMVRKTIKKR